MKFIVERKIFLIGEWNLT